MEYNIFLDMDGIIADFDKRFENLTNLTPKQYINQYGNDEFWKFINKKQGIKFWRGIPIMNGAKQLIKNLEKFPINLLTSPSRDKSSLIGKSLWVKDKTGELFSIKPKLIFAFSKNKKKYASSNSILIDDKESNIKDWEDAGGIAIHYKNYNDVLNQLNKLF